MKNRKYNLLPYETIVKAAAGEPEAVNTVIQTYTGYIKYLSYFQGSINDGIQDHLKVFLMEALPKFLFDRWWVTKAEKALRGTALQTWKHNSWEFVYIPTLKNSSLLRNILLYPRGYLDRQKALIYAACKGRKLSK